MGSGTILMIPFHPNYFFRDHLQMHSRSEVPGCGLQPVNWGDTIQPMTGCLWARLSRHHSESCFERVDGGSPVTLTT